MVGTTPQQMGAWRAWATEALQRYSHEVTILSPLRGKEGLIADAADGGPLVQHTLDGPFSTAQAIMHRDHHDVLMSEVILANLLDAETVSIGTCVELGWAYTHHKPVVAVMEPEGNPHEHPMLTQAITHRVTNLADAVEAVAVLLNVYHYFVEEPA
jgi:nucleoside 2-deoxyribosyltransferase